MIGQLSRDKKKKKEGSLVTAKTFGIMFKRYAAAHMVKEAIEAFHRMGYFNLEPNMTAFHSLIIFLFFLCASTIMLKRQNTCLLRRIQYSLRIRRPSTFFLRGGIREEPGKNVRGFGKKQRKLIAFAQTSFLIQYLWMYLPRLGI